MIHVVIIQPFRVKNGTCFDISQSLCDFPAGDIPIRYMDFYFIQTKGTKTDIFQSPACFSHQAFALIFFGNPTADETSVD